MPPHDGLPHQRIRGTNYLPMTSWSHSLHLAWLPMQAPGTNLRPVVPTDGWYFEPICRQELAQLAARGLNNIRLWGSFLAYCCDPAGYLATLASIAGICRDLGLSITYVMFNVVPAGYASIPGTSARAWLALTGYDGAQLRQRMWDTADLWQILCFQGNTFGAPWGLPAGEVDLTHFTEPASDTDWETLGRFGEWSDARLQSLVKRYVLAVAGFFGRDPVGRAVFQSYDLDNEVDIQFQRFGEPQPVVKSLLIDFLVKVSELIHSVHDGAMTVGWTIGGAGLSTQLLAAGCRVSYVSVHGYAVSEPGWLDLADHWAAAKAEADSLGVPFVASEFLVLPENDGQLRRYLDVLGKLRAGGQVWSILRNGAYRAPIAPATTARIFDGIVTCRTPALSVTTAHRDHAWSGHGADAWAGTPLVFDVEFPEDAAALAAWV